MNKIAKRLGVSRTTVSNILNGRTNEYSYKEETIDLVHKTAAEMGYVMNHVAASLKTGRSLTIAIVVPDIENIFFMDLIKGIEQLSRADNYNLMVCVSEEDLDIERRILRMLRSRMVDGIIIVPVSYHDSFMCCEHLPPTICFDRLPKTCKLPSIILDNEEIAASLALEMVSFDATNPLYMGGNRSDSSNIGRMRGLMQTMTLLRESEDSFEFGIYNEYQAYECIRRKVEAGTFNYDSLFLTTNYFIYGVVRAVEEFDIPIKCLAGFDDFIGNRYIASKTEYPIIIVAQPEQELACTAYDMLKKRMIGEDVSSEVWGLDRVLQYVLD